MKIGAFGKSMAHSRQQRKQQELRNEGKVQYPKGFDITLSDAIAKLNLNEEQIHKLGTLTAQRSSLAHATIGHQVYYRERQLVDMLEVGKAKAWLDGEEIVEQT